MSADHKKVQFFNLLNPPENAIEKMSLGYKKMADTSNRLFLIQIDYKEDQVKRDSILKELPPGGEVLETGVNISGNFTHKKLYLMDPATEGDEKVSLVIRLVERNDGTLYTEYYLEKIQESILFGD